MLEKARRLERLYSVDGLRPINEPVVLAEIGSGHPIITFTPHHNAPFVRTWVRGKSAKRNPQCPDRKVVGAGFTAGIHGNEETGIYILDDLRKTLRPEKGMVRLIAANPYALFQGVRFISEDLNRAFHGSQNSESVEGKLASKILNVVRDSDYTIDLHTTTAETEPFAIVNKKDKERVKLAEATGAEKILLIPREKDYAMIDFVKCGIGIELGPHGSDYTFQAGRRAVQNVLASLGMIQLGRDLNETERECYEFFGTITTPGTRDPKKFSTEIENFRLVKKRRSCSNC